MIEESVIRQVIEQTDIVRLVGEYVQLKRRGRTVTGLCPFHHEKTPSFHVNAERGIFKCFGCGVGGGAVQFLMRIENLSFPEAIERLASRLGIEIERTENRQDLTRKREEKERKRSFIEIMKSAQSYFRAMLEAPCGASCMEYAHRRGISDEMISSFGLGFSPDSWDGLVEHFQRGGYPLEGAVKLGLIAARDRGGYYARFRNRLMFPVHNVKGEIIAYSGRALAPTEAGKYVNSPEVEHFYTKGEHLFGLYQARMHITREHCAILVEGNVDAVMMHGYGFCHTVASLGTALTTKQAALLYRHTRNVYVMYDGDEAGRKAMGRALTVLLGYDFEGLYAVELPNQDDPDSYLRTYGSEGMTSLIANAKSLGMWCVQKKCQDILRLAPELRKAGFGELSELLHGFNDGLTQRHYLEEAARYLGQDIRRLATELGMSLDKPAFQVDASRSVDAAMASFDKIEFTVVYMLLTSRQRYEEFMAQQGIELLQDPALRVLMKEYEAIEDKDTTSSILEGLSENSRNLYERVVCTDIDVSDEDVDLWYEGAVASLICSWAVRERQIVGYDMTAAISRHDTEEVERLLQKDKELLAMQMQSEKDRQYRWQHTA